MSTPDMLGWALRYVAQAWPIFPLHSVTDGRCSCGNPDCTSNAGKHPLSAGGFKDASANPEQVKAWWDGWPDANLGHVPAQSGHVVVDVDGPEGQAAAGQLGLFAEPTLTVLTGRGRHLYFRHPGGTIGNKVLAPKLDLRGDAGYVLLPPSIHRSGIRYRWVGSVRDVRPLPASVVAMLTDPRPMTASSAPIKWSEQPADRLERRIRGYLAQLPRGLADGDGRNNTAFKLGAWLTHDLALDDGVAALWLAEWNHMQRHPLSARELRQVLRNSRRHGSRAIGTAFTDTLPLSDVPESPRRSWADVPESPRRSWGTV